MKIVHYFIFATVICFFSQSFAQDTKKEQLFPMVEIPDSIRSTIGKFLEEEEKVDTSIIAFYLYNYEDPKNYKFQDGIYTFRLMGPHFLPRLLIYKNGRLKIFRNIDINGLLDEYVQFIKSNKDINYIEKINYLKSICRFIEEGVKQNVPDE
jgi:hypothetical protein